MRIRSHQISLADATLLRLEVSNGFYVHLGRFSGPADELSHPISTRTRQYIPASVAIPYVVETSSDSLTLEVNLRLSAHNASVNAWILEKHGVSIASGFMSDELKTRLQVIRSDVNFRIKLYIRDTHADLQKAKNLRNSRNATKR